MYLDYFICGFIGMFFGALGYDVFKGLVSKHRHNMKHNTINTDYWKRPRSIIKNS